MCPINQLGYGITGLNLVKALSNITNVSLTCIGQPQVTNQADADIISSCIMNSKYLNFEAPAIKIWHQHDMSQFPGKGQRIGFPIFELDEFSAIEKHHLQSLDKIFVCSEWAKSIILANINISKENVSVVPLGVDNTIFKPLAGMTSSDKTIFLNCGKWEIRKGHDILSSIFNLAFSSVDNVELWMMCENPFLSQSESEDWTKLYTSSKLGDKIKIIPRMQTQQEVYNIMNGVDCGIFPSRAEGWNLELLEMMACGKSVISTKYSAHTEFCNPNNAKLIDITDLEYAYDGKWFHGKCGSWAKITNAHIEQFAMLMREVHAEKQANVLKMNENGIATAAKYNWKNSAKLVQSYV